MRLDTTQISHYQDIGTFCSIFVGQAYLFKNPGHRLPQRGFCNADLVSCRDFEALQNHGSSHTHQNKV